MSATTFFTWVKASMVSNASSRPKPLPLVPPGPPLPGVPPHPALGLAQAPMAPAPPVTALDS